MKIVILVISAFFMIAWTPVDSNVAAILGHSNTSDWIVKLPVSSVSGTYSVKASLYVENCCDLSGYAFEGDYTGQGLAAYQLYNPDSPSTPLDLIHPWNGMWALSELDWLAETAERDGGTWPVIYDSRTLERITPHWEFLTELKPQWVFINCEINDLWRHYHPSWHNGSLDSVRSYYVDLVDKVQAACPTCDVVIMVSNAAGYERPKWQYRLSPAKYKPLLNYGEITDINVSEHDCDDYQRGTCTSLAGNPNEYDGNEDDGDCFLACAEYFNPNHYRFSLWAKNLAYSRGLRFVSFFEEVGKRYGLDAAGLNDYRDTYLSTDGCPPVCAGCTDTCVRDCVHIFDGYKHMQYYNKIVKPALQRGFRKNKGGFTASK